MIAALDLLPIELSEPAFDLSDPRTLSGCEVQVVARPLGQPVAHQRRLMGGIVIQDDMTS